MEGFAATGGALPVLKVPENDFVYQYGENWRRSGELLWVEKPLEVAGEPVMWMEHLAVSLGYDKEKETFMTQPILNCFRISQGNRSGKDDTSLVWLSPVESVWDKVNFDTVPEDDVQPLGWGDRLFLDEALRLTQIKYSVINIFQIDPEKEGYETEFIIRVLNIHPRHIKAERVGFLGREVHVTWSKLPDKVYDRPAMRRYPHRSYYTENSVALLYLSRCFADPMGMWRYLSGDDEALHLDDASGIHVWPTYMNAVDDEWAYDDARYDLRLFPTWADAWQTI
jgi:hypothetical protein